MNNILKKINYYFSNIKKYIKLNLQILNTLIFLSIYYQLSDKLTRLSTATDSLATSLLNSITIAVDKTIDKLFDIHFTKLKNQNHDLLNTHLSKINKMTKDLALNNESLFKDTSDKTGELILNLYNKQVELAYNLGTPHVNVIQQQSNNKIWIITAVILLSVLAVGAYIYIPKVVTLTQGQFLKLQYLKSEIIRLIPGSNTAEGSIHLKEYTQFKINTSIESGIPELTMINTQTNETQCLLTFIDDLLTKASSNVPISIDTAINAGSCEVVTQAGAVLDIAKFIS